MGAPRETIRDAIKNGEKRQMSEIAKDFQPYLYDIWNLANKETETEYFGVFSIEELKNKLKELACK